MSISSVFKSAMTVTGAFLGYFFGDLDGFIYVIVTVVVIDYITGVMCAIVKRQLSSGIGFKGIFRKICIFFLIGIGHVLDVFILDEIYVFRTIIIFFYTANESISIIENAAFLGLPIPSNLIAVLQQLKKKGGDTKEDKKDK